MTDPMTPEEFDRLPDEGAFVADKPAIIYRLLYAIYEQGRCSYDADKAAAREAAREPSLTGMTQADWDRAEALTKPHGTTTAESPEETA